VSRLDLDELSAAATSRGCLEDADVHALIAELRAARVIVDAARDAATALDKIEDGACGGEWADCDMRCKRVAFDGNAQFLASAIAAYDTL